MDSSRKSAESKDLHNLKVKTSTKDNSGVSEDGTIDLPDLTSNNTDTNNTETKSIILSENGSSDLIDGIDGFKQLIRDNIDYDSYMSIDSNNDKELFHELYELICDTVCIKRNTVRIGKTDYPFEVVKARFLKLDGSHLEYVIECLNKSTSEIRDIRSYLLTALYNAPSTINSYWNQRVQLDMYCGNRTS